jgi:putative transposase
MALDQSALLEVLDALKAADVDDRIRSAATTIYQALIEAELTAVIGAGPHERTEARTAQRNGSRPRTLATTAGDLELRIPKLRAGSFFPSLLERRRRVDQALFAVVMEAYLHGVSTRKVDDLVEALGVGTGISKSEVSRICADLDEEVAASATAAWPSRPSRMCSSPQPTARPGSTAGWSPRPWSSPPGWLPTGTGRCSASPSGFGGRGVLDGVPALAEGPRAGRHPAGHLRRAHRSEGRDRRGAARRQLAAVPGALLRASCWPASRRATPRWSPPRSARSSPSPTPNTCTPSLTSSPACWAASSRRWRPCCARPKTICWPSPPSPWRTGKIWSTNPLERTEPKTARSRR